MNNLLKGIIGASIALALAGGAQAAGQENAATTAQDKTLNDAGTPMQSTPKAKKSTKAKSKMKSSTSSGSSGTGTTGTSGAESQKSSSGTSSTGGSQGSSGQLGNTQSGSAESAGTMNGVGKTSMDGDTKKQMNDNANPTDASGRSSTTPATTTTGQ
jgi:hypothetical protein